MRFISNKAVSYTMIRYHKAFSPIAGKIGEAGNVSYLVSPKKMGYHSFFVIAPPSTVNKEKVPR